jgi:hypothetical protein
VKYQLTLQFRGDSLSDYDAMIALEQELTEKLGIRRTLTVTISALERPTFSFSLPIQQLRFTK